MKLLIQVTDQSGTRRFDQTLEGDDELFLAPGSAEVTLEGIITAIDFHRWQQQGKLAPE